MDGSILSHTRRVAEQLANTFRRDPEGELTIWTTTAQQREAMVVRLYDDAALESRFSDMRGEPAILHVVRKAIAGIWAQERSHTTLVQSLRILGEARATELQTLVGDIEGRMTHTATANSWLRSIASFLVGIGRAMGHAPEFTKAFAELTPREFFRFSHELETTAKEGYARILELLEVLEREPPRAALASESTSVKTEVRFGVTAPYEFAKTLAEECFHAAVFEQLEAWLAPDGHTFRAPAARDAVLRLRELALEHLSTSSKSFQSSPLIERPWTKSADSALVSHGGLGDLFEEYGVDLPRVLPST